MDLILTSFPCVIFWCSIKFLNFSLKAPGFFLLKDGAASFRLSIPLGLKVMWEVARLTWFLSWDLFEQELLFVEVLYAVSVIFEFYSITMGYF